MTGTEANRIRRRMLLIIPGMILAIIGDYCMGLEPADSYAISGMISSGWLTIADWRIAVSNVGGMLGTALYTVAALAFIRYLHSTGLANAKENGIGFSSKPTLSAWSGASWFSCISILPAER